MKIVIFDDLPEGGAKRVVYEQIRGLSSRHQVILFTNPTPSRFPFPHVATGVVQTQLQLPYHSGFFRPLTELGFFSLSQRYRQLARQIDDLHPDWVIVHPSQLTQAPLLLNYLQSPSVYFGEEWLRLAYEPDLHPLPSGVTGIYEWGRRRLIQFLDRQAVNQASQVIVTSQFVAEEFFQAYHLKPKVNPLGVDTALFSPPAPDQPRSGFLFVGNQEKINGYPLLQQALQLMKVKPKINYVSFKKNQFRLSDRQLAKLYQSSLATLCLSIREPFGLVPLESMACGCPPIAVDEGGYLETILPNRTGIIIPRQPQALADAMSLLISRPSTRRRLGKVGQSHVSRKYSWERHIIALETLLS